MVDIIIRAKNGHDLTRACIDSIVKNTPDSYRLILVDDGSSTFQDASECDYYVRSSESRGAVTATNLGLAIALQLSGDYVIVLDNDTRVPDGDKTWLDRWIGELEQAGPETAAIGATTNFANPPQHILTVPQTYTADWRNEGKAGEKNNPPVRWFVSFAVLLRKSALRVCGLWDEQFNPGNWEDTDYAITLRKSGFQIRVARSVYIHHDGHKTFGKDLHQLLATNKEKFLRKWGIGCVWDMGLLSNEEMSGVLRGMAKK